MNRLRPTLATFLLGLLPLALAPTSPAQEAPAATEQPVSHPFDLGLSPERAARKGPDGVSYREAVERALIYTAGSNKLNQIMLGVLMDEEIAHRKAAGLSDELFRVSDEDLQAHIEALTKKVRDQNPDADFWEQVRTTGNTPEGFREQTRRMMELDRLFFPDDPDAWPLDELAEIYRKGEKNSIYDNTIVKTLEALKEAKATGKPFQIDDMMMQMILRPYILNWMWRKAEIVQPFQGLPEGVALRIDGHDFSTKDLLQRTGLNVGPVEKQRAKMFVDLCWALEKELAAEGKLLTPQEALDLIAEEKKQYVNSPISYEQVALQFLGYPSLEIYDEVYRLKQSFRRTLPDPIPTETLQAHVEKRKAFLGDGKVKAEVILFSARDMATGLFPLEGDPFAAAEKRARQAAEELAAGADWDTVLTRYSDFPDKVPGSAEGLPQPHRGRLGLQSRNPLRDFLAENDYTDFLYGVSVGDQIFFDAEMGNIYGPVRGPVGWYIYRVVQRQPPSKELDLAENSRHLYLATDDYITVEFHDFIDRVMAKQEG